MRRSTIRSAIAWLLAAVSAEAAAANTGSLRGTVIERERADGTRSLGLTVSQAELEELPIRRGFDRSFEEIDVFAPRNVLRGGKLAYAPEGWRLDAQRGRLTGPAVHSGDFRIDYGRDWAPPREIQIDFRADGRSVYRDTLPVESRPRVTLSTDYREWLELPRALRVRSTFRIEPLARDKYQLGLGWKFENEDPYLNFDWRPNTAGQLEAEVPNPYTMHGWSPHYEPLWPWEREYQVTGVDRWGDTWVRSTWRPIFLPLSYGLTAPLAFDDATEIVAPNSQLCVCGLVPDLGDWSKLSLGGLALGAPIAASDSSAVFPLPAGLGLGDQPIEYAPWQGAGRSTGLGTSKIEVIGKIDYDVIQRGGSTPLSLEIRGTTRSFPLQLTNKTTEIIDLEGGPVIRTTTPGGTDNRVVRKVTGLSPGTFNVEYRVDLPSCPCDAGHQQVADRLGQETASFFSHCATTAAQLDRADPRGETREMETTFDASPPPATREAPTTFLPAPTARLSAMGWKCEPGARELSLLGGRLRLHLDLGAEAGGGACVHTGRADSGLFYGGPTGEAAYFVRAVDACDVNGRGWLLAAATTNVAFTLRATDLGSGETKSYVHPGGAVSPAIVDASAFLFCP